MYPPKPLLIAALLLALLLRAGQQGTRAADTTAPNVAAIDAYVQAEMRGAGPWTGAGHRARYPGRAYAWLWRRRRGQSCYPADGLYSRSMSKAFTAVAIMQLVE